MRIRTVGTWLVVAGASLVAPLVHSPASNSALAAPKSDAGFRAPRDWTWANDDAAWNKIQSLVGKRAPALTVKDWIGTEPKPADVRGQIVVFDFWATWCGPCIRAIPHTNEIMDQYASQGVKVVGVCATRGGEKMKETVAKHDMRYPTAVDVAERTTSAWAVQWFPYYVIVDRNGVVRAAGLRPERVGDFLEKLIAEQPMENSKPAPGD